jgi:hypothetical protein
MGFLTVTYVELFLICCNSDVRVTLKFLAHL